MSDNQVSAGQKVKDSPLRDSSTVNLMLRAAHAYRDTELGSPRPTAEPSENGDVIKLTNSSGGNLLRGNVLAIGAELLNEKSRKYKWFDGDAIADASDAIAIYQAACPSTDNAPACITGVCIALVNVTDTSHKWADVTVGETVLASGDSGRVEILSTPSSTGEQECFVNITNVRSTCCDDSYYSSVELINTCSYAVSSVLRVSWVDNLDDYLNGSAVLTYDADEPDHISSGGGSWFASEANESTPFGRYPNLFSDEGANYIQFYCDPTVDSNQWRLYFCGGSIPSSYIDAQLIQIAHGTYGAPPITINQTGTYQFNSMGAEIPYDVTITIEAIPSGVETLWIRNTSGNWTDANTVLRDGDYGIEKDGGKFKIGDGSTAWNDLAYATPTSVAAADITDATAAGQAILTAADNAAIRTLLNVEDGATADQTGAEIKAAYEGEANTNAFTDAEKTLLGNQSGTNTGDQDISGIATNAGNISTNTAAIALNTAKVTANTANVQAAGALMDSELTNESAVKAFNPSANGTSLVSAANYAAMRGLLDLEAGTDFYSKASADSTFLQNITSENLTDLSDVDTDKSKTPSDGDVLTFDGTDWNAETPAASGGTANGYMLYQDQKSDGTAGGSSVANTWTARELNTEVADTNGNGSLSSNQITLDAGTYLYRAWAPFLDVQDVRLRLYNATDATVIELGDGCAYSASTGDATSAQIVGRFTIAASKAIELQYYADLVQGGNGLGFHDGLALGVEKYARIELLKIETSDAQEYILIQDQKSDGTDGGSSTATTWTARELNTEVYDTGNNCSLSSNQFTLNAGTYRYTASAPFLNSQDVRLRLYNVTDAAEVSGSLSDGGYSASTGDAIRVEATGRFTIASAKAFELQYYLDNAQATIGLGFDDGQTLGVEKYSRIELIKEG